MNTTTTAGTLIGARVGIEICPDGHPLVSSTEHVKTERFGITRPVTVLTCSAQWHSWSTPAE